MLLAPAVIDVTALGERDVADVFFLLLAPAVIDDTALFECDVSHVFFMRRRRRPSSMTVLDVEHPLAAKTIAVADLCAALFGVMLQMCLSSSSPHAVSSDAALERWRRCVC